MTRFPFGGILINVDKRSLNGNLFEKSKYPFNICSATLSSWLDACLFHIYEATCNWLPSDEKRYMCVCVAPTVWRLCQVSRSRDHPAEMEQANPHITSTSDTSYSVGTSPDTMRVASVVETGHASPATQGSLGQYHDAENVMEQGPQVLGRYCKVSAIKRCD